MYVPFVFSLDSITQSENFYFFGQYYFYAEACLRNNWPIITHQRYVDRLSYIEDKVFNTPIKAIASSYCMNRIPTTEEMLSLKAYPISQAKEDALIVKYPSQLECWMDLLTNENSEFEKIIDDLIEQIIKDCGEKPEGILTYENLPISLLKAANKHQIPVILQVGGVVRPPLAETMNAFCLINTNSSDSIKSKYGRLISSDTGFLTLSHKGLLRLFSAQKYMADIHNIDNAPEYDVGVLYNNLHVAFQASQDDYLTDQQLSVLVSQKYDSVLVRTRPGFGLRDDSTDNSPTCFHFCCKCKRIVGYATKGVFEAMLAGRIPHEYGRYFFTAFCNKGINDESIGVASLEFLNFVMFGLCIPFSWLTDPDYLRFLLANHSEKEQYMRSFSYYTQGISKEDLAFYYMSNDRAYRLGDTLYFYGRHSPHQYASYYCIDALHYNGGQYTWSNDEQTSFLFDLDDTKITALTISVGLSEVAMNWDSPNPSQTVTCTVNGIDCGSVILVPGRKHMRFLVPKECFDDKLKVTFTYSYLHRSEGFTFAVAFAEMCIGYSGQRIIEDSMSNENIMLSNEIANISNSLDILESTRVIDLETQINSIYDSRSWKLGNGIMKLFAKIFSKKTKRSN